MLEISPAPASCVKVMKHCISLFAGEMRVALIQNKLKLDPSLDALNIDRLFFDESRVVQIVVNLLSNGNTLTYSFYRTYANSHHSHQVHPC
jgi:signal transduction histidine kinase